MDYGEEKESASCQQREMPMFGSTFGKNCIIWQKGHFGGSATCKSTSHEEKKRKICRIFEKFIIEGNEKADELAKGGALQDTGFMAEARPETMQQEREELYAALQYTARFHCLVEEWTEREKS